MGDEQLGITFETGRNDQIETIDRTAHGSSKSTIFWPFNEVAGSQFKLTCENKFEPVLNTTS